MTIEETLANLQLTMESKLKEDTYDGVHGSHTHTVKLSRFGHSVSMKFTAGCAHRTPQPKHKWNGGYTIHEVAMNQATKPNPPSLSDVVYALLSDSQCVMHGQSFDDFCDEFGYDSDSRGAKKIYKGCIKQWGKYVKLGLDMEDLEDLFADY
jgi:hypothetical protein